MKKLKKILFVMLTAVAMILVLGLTAGAASKVTGITLRSRSLGADVAVKGGMINLFVYPTGDISEEESKNFEKKAKATFTVKKNKTYVSSLTKPSYSNLASYCTAKKTRFLTFEAKVVYGGKTYKSSCKVWITDKTPIKSLTWGNSIKIGINDYCSPGIYSNKTGSQKISVTANKGWKILSVTGEAQDDFLDSGFLNTSTYTTTASYTGDDDASLNITLQAKKDGKTYVVGYTPWRMKYDQYELTYKGMKNGTTIQLGAPNVLYRYNKNAKSKPIITKWKNGYSKYTIEFKSLKDLQKKMSTYRYPNTFVPPVSGEFRVSGSKLIMKVPKNFKVKLTNPGKGTSLKKTV